VPITAQGSPVCQRNAPVDGFTWPTEPPKLRPPMVVPSPLRYSVPAGPFQTALEMHTPRAPPGTPSRSVHTGELPSGLSARV